MLKKLITLFVIHLLIFSCGGSDAMEDISTPSTNISKDSQSLNNSSSNGNNTSDNSPTDNSTSNNSSTGNNTSNNQTNSNGLLDNAYDYKADKNFMNDEMSRMMDCIETLERGYLSNLFIDFVENLDSDDGEKYIEDMLDRLYELEIGKELDDIFDNDMLEQSPFNYKSHTAEYFYDKVNWNIENQGSENLTFYIPLFQNSTFYDFAIQISNLTQDLIAIETPIYFPTNVELNAYHKNTAEGNWDNIFSLRTDDLRYEIIDEIPIPNNISLYIYTSPFQHNLSITKINPKTFDIAFYMDESQCNFSINSRIELTNSDYENLDLEDDLKSLDLTIVMNDLSFKINAELEYLLPIEDPTPNQINNFINVDVLKKGNKIAELKYFENDEDEDIKTIFLDLTEIGSEEFPMMGENFSKLEDRFEGILSRYTNNFD